MKIPFVSQIMNKLRSGERPPLERFYIIAFILFLGFLVGDLATLYVRQYLLPTTVPPKKVVAQARQQTKSYNFSEIVNKNIFNADGEIPPAVGETEGGGGGVDGTPQPSDLPLDLIGTIVHANPAKSLATIAIKGQSQVESYAVGQTIPGMAEIKEILREKVIFRNLKTQTIQFIEIPQDGRLTINMEKSSSTTPAKGAEKTEFSFKRAEVEKQLDNLPMLLQQARAIPVTGADGQVRGFRLVEIQAGSIYEQLGVKIGDLIKSVNGMNLTSPQEAMGAYQSLRSANEIKLVVERDNRDVTLNFTLQ